MVSFDATSVPPPPATVEQVSDDDENDVDGKKDSAGASVYRFQSNITKRTNVLQIFLHHGCTVMKWLIIFRVRVG
jgi:hypothetical protein